MQRECSMRQQEKGSETEFRKLAPCSAPFFLLFHFAGIQMLLWYGSIGFLLCTVKFQARNHSFIGHLNYFALKSKKQNLLPTAGPLHLKDSAFPLLEGRARRVHSQIKSSQSIGNKGQLQRTAETKDTGSKRIGKWSEQVPLEKPARVSLCLPFWDGKVCFVHQPFHTADWPPSVPVYWSFTAGRRSRRCHSLCPRRGRDRRSDVVHHGAMKGNH